MSTKITDIQRTHCAAAPCMMNGDDWMRHFISHILHMTQSQRIFRNVTLHDSICGTLRLQKQEEVLREVETRLETDPLEVPAESKFLLEFDFDSLYRSSFERQTYWVRAIKAARRAGRRTGLLRSRRGAGARRRAGRGRRTRPTIDVSVVVEQMRAEQMLRPLPSQRRVRPNIRDSVDNPCNKRLRKPD